MSMGMLWVLLPFGIYFIGMILSVVFLCLWTYHDAKNRGLDAPLWTIIVLFGSFIGLLLYFIIGRNQTMLRCTACNHNNPKGAQFCSSCGSTLGETYVAAQPMQGQKGTKGYLVGFFVSLAASIACLIIFLVMTITAGFVGSLGEGSIQNGISIGSVENRFGNKWDVSFMRSTMDFNTTLNIRDGEPKTLCIEADAREGEFSLHLRQNGEDGLIEKDIDLTDMNGPCQYDLSEFGDGKLTLTLQNDGAKNVKFTCYWE